MCVCVCVCGGGGVEGGPEGGRTRVERKSGPANSVSIGSLEALDVM